MSEKNNYPCLLLLNDLHIGKENIPEFSKNWNEALRICGELENTVKLTTQKRIKLTT